jgi:hypothetical protein
MSPRAASPPPRWRSWRTADQHVPTGQPESRLPWERQATAARAPTHPPRHPGVHPQEIQRPLPMPARPGPAPRRSKPAVQTGFRYLDDDPAGWSRQPPPKELLVSTFSAKDVRGRGEGHHHAPAGPACGPADYHPAVLDRHRIGEGSIPFARSNRKPQLSGLTLAMLAFADSNEPQAVVLCEVSEILHVQRGQRQTSHKAAGGDPRIVDRLWAPPAGRTGLQLTPANRNQIGVGQRHNVLPPVSQLGQLARPPTAQHCPLGQLAQGHKRDAPCLAG